MSDTNSQSINSLYIQVTGAGLPEVDGLYIPSTEPPKESESGTLSSLGYWNGRMAWDRADGKSARSPAISYSNSYKSWRICRLDGHLAYDNTCDDELPPVGSAWHVYKKGVAPAPSVVVHHFDPREPCPAPNVVFVIGGPGSGKGTMCELAKVQLGWEHLSTGELLRAELESGGPQAMSIDKYIAAGELVPNEIIVTLLKESMEKITRTTGKRNFLLDVEKRILSRAKYSGRSDDNVKSMKLRFDTYKAETLPTVEFFRDKNKCVEIDSSKSREAVYSEVVSSLAEHTDKQYQDQPWSDRAEILLGLRPYPKS